MWYSFLLSDLKGRALIETVSEPIISVKTETVARSCIKLRIYELRNIQAPPNIIRVLKPKCVRWAGHVTRKGETRNSPKLLVGRSEGRMLVGRA
jgi:hypothetical protein